MDDAGGQRFLHGQPRGDMEGRDRSRADDPRLLAVGAYRRGDQERGRRDEVEVVSDDRWAWLLPVGRYHPATRWAFGEMKTFRAFLSKITLRDFITGLLIAGLIFTVVVGSAISQQRANETQLVVACTSAKANIEQLEALRAVARTLGLPSNTVVIPPLPPECA